MKYSLSNKIRGFQPIRELQIQQSTHLIVKKQSVSSDFSQFQMPDRICNYYKDIEDDIQQNLGTQQCQDMSPYLKPSMLNHQLKNTHNQKQFRKVKKVMKNSKSVGYLTNKITPKLSSKIDLKTHNRSLQSKKKSSLKSIRLNQGVQNKTRINKSSSMHIKYDDTYPRGRQNNNKTLFKQEYKMRINMRNQRQSDGFEKIHKNTQQINTNGEELITNYSKQQFKANLLDYLRSASKNNDKIVKQQNQPRNKQKQNYTARQQQEKKEYKQNKGGICFDVDIRQFSKNKSNNNEVRYIKKKKNKKNQEINTKQQLLRRRQKAFNYGQIIRFRNFGPHY